MAGSQPFNIFKLSTGSTPKEALNWRLFTAVLCFGLMGASRGIDEGLISGTIQQVSFIEQYHLNDPNLSTQKRLQITGNITAMVQIGCVFGSIVAFLVCDRIGRIWATRELCVVWIVGIIIFLTADGKLGQIYAGRFIAGAGIGQTAVVAPTYLAEIAPRAIRGLCICVFSGSVYLGIMLAYFASWGAATNISNENNLQWILPSTMHIMFAVVILVLTFFTPESPRYYLKVGEYEKGVKTLSYIRNLKPDHSYVEQEVNEIQDQLMIEEDASSSSRWFGTVKELFTSRSNLYCLHIGIMSQLLGQWSGASSITIYAPSFFEMLGNTGQGEKLFATCILGIVKLVASLACALFLIDFLGRKRALSIGISLQVISMLYIAIYLTAVPQLEYSANVTGSAKSAGKVAVAFIYFSGIGWAVGWNSLQYLINAEIYPLRVRALGSSLIMCFHFINQYANSKTVPLMLSKSSLTPAGTFWFFAAVTLLGLVWMHFFLPETSSLSLEGTQVLFQQPWYKIGRTTFISEETDADISSKVNSLPNDKLSDAT
ncbi:general substrate transporter [Dipodascopsis uninucleata]